LGNVAGRWYYFEGNEGDHESTIVDEDGSKSPFKAYNAFRKK
jgi:hypothetical protein